MRIIHVVIVVLVSVAGIVLIITQFRVGKATTGGYEGPEAMAWLKNNKNLHAFASNHFKSTQDAVRFVEKLYGQGAETVAIPSDCIADEPDIIKEEGGPSADGMAVRLPRDKEKRRAILAACNSELDPEYRGDLEKQVEGGMIFLWWD